jgi:cytochrome b involved in lipid metabolism
VLGDVSTEQAPTKSPIAEQDVEPEEEPEDQPRKITLGEIALHDSEDDLWVAMHGMVYDLTDYALLHPGGAIFITGVAGTDASDAYDDFHPLTLLPLVKQHIIGVFLEEETSSAPQVSPTYSPTVADDGENDDLAQATPMPSPTPQPSALVPATIWPTTEQDAACLLRLITMEEIEQHANDMWVLIYKRVYDLSSFNHPGGISYIRQAAGTDATNLFETKHTIDILYDETKGIQHLMIGKVNSESQLVNICDTTTEQATSSPTPEPTLAPIVPFPDTGSSTDTPDPACLERLITMSEVEAHQDDRWVVFYDRVYDLSSYTHPGGNSYIRLAAGTDGTDFFETHHVESLLYNSRRGIQYLWIGRLSSESGFLNIC